MFLYEFPSLVNPSPMKWTIHRHQSRANFFNPSNAVSHAQFRVEAIAQAQSRIRLAPSPRSAPSQISGTALENAIDNVAANCGSSTEDSSIAHLLAEFLALLLQLAILATIRAGG
jgi:hypothetical protein